MGRKFRSETSRHRELDPDQRIDNALDNPDGHGGPFTKAQQQEKVQRTGDKHAATS